MIEKLRDLFAGRYDTYLSWTRDPDAKKGFAYSAKEEPISDKVWKNHINGIAGFSVYPAVDGEAKWAAYDIDAKDFNNGMDGAYACAKTQYEALQRNGFHSYLEISKSGLGYHIWVFFSDWVSVEQLSNVFKHLKIDGVETWYPKLSDSKVGTALAIPFFDYKNQKVSNSKIVDSNGEAFTLQRFVKDVKLNSPVVLDEIKVPASKNIVQVIRQIDDKEQVTGALKLISPYGCRFMRYAWQNREILSEAMWYTAIGQATQFRNGRDFAHLISRDYPNYSESEVDAKYDHALQNPPRSWSYIRENFPEFENENTTVSHPYKSANKTISELAYSSNELIRRVGDFEEDIAYIRALNTGKATSGISFGIDGLDKALKLRKSELVVIGGLPNIGKTWLMVESMINQAKAGTNVFAFSAETSATPLRLRLLAHASQIPLTKLRGEDYEKLTNPEYRILESANRELSQLPLYVDYTTLSADAMLAQIESAILRDRLSLDSQFSVVFDYLQFGLKSDKAESDRERFGRLVGELKMMGKILEMPVTSYSQLTRQSEGQEKPTQSWFAETSQIERNMDIGIIITGSRMAGVVSPRELHLVKQREGRSNEVFNYLLNHAYGHWQYVDVDTDRPPENLLADFGV